MSEVKTIAIFLPFLGACLYGLSYALIEKIFGTVTITTYIFVSGLVSCVGMALIHMFSPIKIDFSPILERGIAFPFFLSILAVGAAWFITTFAIKNVSANYAAIAEICYPLFTVLFGYLLFGRKLGWSMALGAALIFAGVLLIVTDKANGR